MFIEYLVRARYCIGAGGKLVKTKNENMQKYLCVCRELGGGSSGLKKQPVCGPGVGVCLTYEQISKMTCVAESDSRRR